MKSILWGLPLLFLVFGSCRSDSAAGENSQTSYTLEIVDSVKVPYLGKLNLMDVSPENEVILLFDPQNMKFVSSDFEGNLLGEFSKERDAPDGFGFYPMAAGRFNSSKNIQVISSSGVFEYDLAGNLQASTKVPKDQIQPFSGRIDAKRELFFVDDRILTAGLVARGEFNKTQPEFYDTFLQLVWADPLTGDYERFLPLDPESIFQNNRSHEPSTISPSFDLVDGQLYVITGIDPYLNIHQLDPPYTRIKRIPLALKDYQLNEGEDPKKADPRAISYDPSFGIVQKLAKVGDQLIITYETGYDTQDALSSKENKTAEEWADFNSQVALKYKPRYQVLDLEGKMLHDSEIPAKLSDVYVSREGALWFLGKPNPEKEEDFYMIYKVELK